MIRELAKAPGLRCAGPSGAFYLYVNISDLIGRTTKGGRLIDSDVDFVTALLAEKHVATVQGAAYGLSPYFRLSFATDLESLKEASSRIGDFCAELYSPANTAVA